SRRRRCIGEDEAGEASIWAWSGKRREEIERNNAGTIGEETPSNVPEKLESSRYDDVASMFKNSK
ncbi:hypothetical protein Tsubulata_005528, partial [Turnera subulata]